jgi:hypothetical protein
MQTPTHLVAGMVIQKAFAGRNRAAALTTTAVVGFLSHGFLDKLARVTYHPADPDFHSVFWVSYHLTLLATTIVFLRLWWRQYKWGIVFANLPDVDWIFIHGQEIFHFQIPFYRHPHLHDLLGYIYEKIPPFTFVTSAINRLPNERHNPWACLWEVLLVAVLLLIFWLLTLARSYRPERRPPARLDTAGGPAGQASTGVQTSRVGDRRSEEGPVGQGPAAAVASNRAKPPPTNEQK